MEYWHLLSLDAPTVAVAWSWAFAGATGVSLHPLSALLLGVATWLLYVADRLLDGRYSRISAESHGLRERHYFHARHRAKFLAIACPAVCVLAWLVVTRMDRAPRLEDLSLCAAAGLYLMLVHLPAFPFSRLRLLSKEAAVAVIFATACIIPSWSRQTEAHGWLMLMGIPFSMLCWLNCVAIEMWESGRESTTRKFLSIDIEKNLRLACGVVSAASLSLAMLALLRHRAAVAAVLLCVVVSALSLLLLDRVRAHVMPLRIRAAADAVLLTPALFLLVRYLAHRA